jgi:hypothetical protein
MIVRIYIRFDSQVIVSVYSLIYRLVDGIKLYLYNVCLGEYDSRFLRGNFNERNRILCVFSWLYICNCCFNYTCFCVNMLSVCWVIIL